MFPRVRMYVFFGVAFIVVPVLGRQPRRLARVSLPCVLRPAFHSPPSHRRAPASPLPRRRAVNADKRYPRTRSLPHFCSSRNSVNQFVFSIFITPNHTTAWCGKDTKNILKVATEHEKNGGSLEIPPTPAVAAEWWAARTIPFGRHSTAKTPYTSVPHTLAKPPHIIWPNGISSSPVTKSPKSTP